jgi:hypothetical protein
MEKVKDNWEQTLDKWYLVELRKLRVIFELRKLRAIFRVVFWAIFSEPDNAEDKILDIVEGRIFGGLDNVVGGILEKVKGSSLGFWESIRSRGILLESEGGISRARAG